MPRDLAYERARRQDFLRKYVDDYTEDNNLSPPRALVGESILVNLHNKGTDIEHPHLATVMDIKKNFLEEHAGIYLDMKMVLKNG